MNKKLKFFFMVIIPMICLLVAGIPFTLADYPESDMPQTIIETTAEDTGAGTADKSFKGGSVYLSGGADYTMSGGTISGKDNVYGGAIYISNGSTFTMEAGTITGCSALYGGAIYVEAGGTCNINGGSISGNKAQYAPAIYVENGGVLNVTSESIMDDNIYEKYGNPLEIYVDGTLATTRYIKSDTYVIDENEMPLTYENCCGYFLDEKLSKCSFGEIALTSEAMGFAPRTADAENYVARLYTRTASDLSNFTFTYDSTTSTYTIKGSSSHAGDLVLPKEYNNVQTSLYSASGWGGAFCQSSTITGITFQEGLKNIPNYTFSQANKLVGDMVFPDSVITIGRQAFWNARLGGTLSLPNSLITIGESAFYSSSGLTGDLIIPNSVTTIGSSAFFNCYGFTGDLVIGDNVSSLEWGVFEQCSGFTGTLTLGKSLTKIDGYAFRLCNKFTGEVVIPDSVESIGEQAFYWCEKLTGLKLGSGLKSIGEVAFSQCYKMVGELNFGENLETIGRGAFQSCKFTGSLTIPDSVVSIGADAFAGGYSFTGVVTIGSGLQSVGSGAFTYVSQNITGITVDRDNSYFNSDKNALVETATKRLVLGCNTTDFTVISGVDIIDKYAFWGCGNLTGELIFSDTLTSIGEYAFYRCYKITGGINIPDSLTSLGKWAFDVCSGLTGALRISNSLTTIPEGAFAYCKNLTGELIIPEGITKIYDYAFVHCWGLTGDLVIPDGVTSIGKSAFSSLKALDGTLVIPDSVTNIGNTAFDYCQKLTGNIIIPASVKTLGAGVFGNCPEIESVYVPSTVTTISSSSYYNALFYNCSSSLAIYTDVADADSEPTGWGAYWDYYDSTTQYSINYGVSLETYKSTVGITFASTSLGNNNEGVEMQESEHMTLTTIDNGNFVIFKKQEIE